MSAIRMTQESGWTIGRSIMIEIGLILDALGERPPLPELPMGLDSLKASLPESWHRERVALLGDGRGPLQLPLRMAWAADALFLDDYTEATRRIRRLDMAQMLERTSEHAARKGIEPDQSLEPGLRHARLWGEMSRADYRPEDLPELTNRPVAEGHALAQLPKLLRGGEWHDRFWHWLDHFYYRRYAPWRAERESEMDALEQRAVMLLGAQQCSTRAPRLDWMPPSSPLLNFPGLRQAAEEGRVPVFFLVEPLGISTMLLTMPGMLVTAFAQQGALHQRYQEHVEELAGRLKAVADPTRLKILRLMRHLELDNTQIAALLQVARPTVSIHARQLREAGLIETRREGRKARHTVNVEAVETLFADLAALLDLPEA